MLAAASRLLAAGVAAGAIRDDVTPADVVRGVSGACLASGDEAGWAQGAQRLAELLIDGLRQPARG